jgi:peptide-methionine (R)-S-oxide reductase
MKRTEKNDAEWRDELTPEQYEVCREKGTEAPFTGKYDHCTDDGTYVCVCCGQELFSADYKYDSGSGWPSFTRPLEDENVVTDTDSSLGMVRTEVMCSGCDAHLGHVFEDAPLDSGKRYCINSVALDLKASK